MRPVTAALQAAHTHDAELSGVRSRLKPGMNVSGDAVGYSGFAFVEATSTIVDIMSTNELASALFTRTRAGILAVLALAPEQELHVREVARRSALDPSGVMRELRLLERHGILVARRVGRQKLYRMNPDSPLYAELASIMRKTAGLADLIRAALLPLAEQLELAYIYGSMASGKLRPDSDVDVMVVGAASSVDLAGALDSTSRALGREVNFSVYLPTEYWSKVESGRGFPYTAHAGPKILLLGNVDAPA